MKNRYYLIRLVAFLLLAGATFVSCNKEGTITGTFTMTVNATKGDSHVKALNPESETGRPLATWAEGEKVTVYNVTTGQLLTGTLTAQSAGQSTTTLSGDITGTISDNDVLELRFLSPNYRIQNGTLAGIGSVCDYAKATVTASVSDQGVTTNPSTATFVNQQAIVRFTLKESDGTTNLSANTLIVCVGNKTYSVLPKNATNELYVALPGFSSQTVSLFAKSGVVWHNLQKTGVSFANGQYYTVTLKMTPLDTLPGPVSVDTAGHKVFFSPGNLQYQASTQTWRFALNQKDYVGDGNTQISKTYNGWIDLFGWGTSGEGNSNPYNTTTNTSDYGPISGNIAGTNYDWGVKNAISNGGNAAGMWRTLTSTEWDYILNERKDDKGKSIPRFIKAEINETAGVHPFGLIIFPDNYVHPSTVVSLENLDTNQGTARWKLFSTAEWNAMEAAGAIFLPAAGYRDGVSVASVTSEGDYWSATSESNYKAHRVLFNYSGGTGDYSATNSTPRFLGYSVRLVRDLQ